ncbi:hypothetical protein H4Q26_011027 [Puccinia striiformis f. sp. tritici PST-130]|nr:hypothetical protein H4Q26_011027 [Puccinia striiformis f. sp. tritici PST-130]
MENQPLDILSELASSAAAQEQQQEQEPISDQAFQALLLHHSTNQQHQQTAAALITQHQHAQDLLSALSALQTEPSSSLTQIEPFQPSQQQQQSQDELDFDDPNLFSPFDPGHHHHLQQDPVSLTDQIDLLLALLNLHFFCQESLLQLILIPTATTTIRAPARQDLSQLDNQLDLYHHLPLDDHHEFNFLFIPIIINNNQFHLQINLTQNSIQKILIIRSMLSISKHCLSEIQQQQKSSSFASTSKHTLPSLPHQQGSKHSTLISDQIAPISLPWFKHKFGVVQIYLISKMEKEEINITLVTFTTMAALNVGNCEEVANILKTNNQNKSEIDWKSSPKQRKPIECKIQWTQKQDPSLNKSKWTLPEIDRLFEIVKKFDHKNWDLISNELATGRTASECVKQFRIVTQEKHHSPIDSSSDLTPTTPLIIHHPTPTPPPPEPDPPPPPVTSTATTVSQTTTVTNNSPFSRAPNSRLQIVNKRIKYST